MELIIWLSVLTATVSYTVTETRIFYPLRIWISKRSRFFGDLINCGYCTGHWVAFFLTAVYRPRLFDFYWLLDYFFTALAIAWLGALQWILMCLLMKNAGK